MTRVQIILSWTLAAGAVFPAMAAPGRYPISVEQVAATMGRMGMRIP